MLLARVIAFFIAVPFAENTYTSALEKLALFVVRRDYFLNAAKYCFPYPSLLFISA